MSIVTNGSKIDKILVDGVEVTTSGLDKSKLVTALQYSGLGITNSTSDADIYTKLSNKFPRTYTAFRIYTTDNSNNKASVGIYKGYTTSSTSITNWVETEYLGSWIYTYGTISSEKLNPFAVDPSWQIRCSTQWYFCSSISSAGVRQTSGDKIGWHWGSVVDYYVIPIVT